MKLILNPFDTLFFKDGKPFTMGQETWADGIFPPPPSVIYGALRASYFGENSADFNKAGTEDDPTSDFVIDNIYYKIDGDDYFPLPLDLFTGKDKTKEEINREKREKKYYVKSFSADKKNVISNYYENSFRFLEAKEEIYSFEDGLIKDVELKSYLDGNSSTIICRRIGDFALSEPKVGIGRDNNRRSTEEGKLYRVGMRRVRKLKFVVILRNNDIKITEYSKFGAESKVVKISSPDDKNSFDYKPNISGKKFKMYISTPAIFSNGWIPDFLSRDNLEGNFCGYRVRLISAFIGKPLLIGGFDMAKKYPKPMKKTVPAGSVYYFELLEPNTSNYDFTANQNISDEQYSKQGFGKYYIGELK